MSNKMTIKKSEKPVKKEKEKKDAGSTKRRLDPAKYVPIVAVVVLWVVFFIYMW